MALGAGKFCFITQLLTGDGMAKARDYAAEYRNFHGKPAEIKKRAMRNKAHATMAKKVGKAALTGKDVDHATPLRAGGSNSPSNLRVRSVHLNRGYEADKRRK